MGSPVISQVSWSVGGPFHISRLIKCPSSSSLLWLLWGAVLYLPCVSLFAPFDFVLLVGPVSLLVNRSSSYLILLSMPVMPFSAYLFPFCKRTICLSVGADVDVYCPSSLLGRVSQYLPRQSSRLPLLCKFIIYRFNMD